MLIRDDVWAIHTEDDLAGSAQAVQRAGGRSTAEPSTADERLSHAGLRRVSAGRGRGTSRREAAMGPGSELGEGCEDGRSARQRTGGDGARAPGLPRGIRTAAMSHSGRRVVRVAQGSGQEAAVLHHAGEEPGADVVRRTVGAVGARG